MSHDATKRMDRPTGFIQAPIMTTASYFILMVDPARWQEAIDFFETTIGLMLRVNEAPHWAEFAAGKITFALHSKAGVAPKETGFVFDCETCDGAVAALEARGVKITKKPEEVAGPGSNRCFDFLDPFGNTFSGYGK